MTAGQRTRRRVGPYSWRRIPGSDHFTVWRDGSPRRVTYTGYEPAALEASLRDEWEREEAVAAALATSEPRALCGLGWHRLADGSFFEWMGTGRVGVRLNFWIGCEPVRWSATKIAGIGPQAVPWDCSVCGDRVPETGR